MAITDNVTVNAVQGTHALSSGNPFSVSLQPSSGNIGKFIFARLSVAGSSSDTETLNIILKPGTGSNITLLTVTAAASTPASIYWGNVLNYTPNINNSQGLIIDNSNYIILSASAPGGGETLTYEYQWLELS